MQLVQGLKKNRDHLVVEFRFFNFFKQIIFFKALFLMGYKNIRELNVSQLMVQLF